MLRFMKKVKKNNVNSSCFILYDKLYVDNKMYVWDPDLGQVLVLSAVKCKCFLSVGSDKKILFSDRSVGVSNVNVSCAQDQIKRSSYQIDL